jgi:hypothetical protein
MPSTAQSRALFSLLAVIPQLIIAERQANFNLINDG